NCCVAPFRTVVMESLEIASLSTVIAPGSMCDVRGTPKIRPLSEKPCQIAASHHFGTVVMESLEIATLSTVIAPGSLCDVRGTPRDRSSLGGKPYLPHLAKLSK